ncbi:MAG: Shedu anti-phage system protein SduA domain-containing protein, partial [Patescibacteria group bacterium]
GGIIPLKPKGLIVHGRNNIWDKSEWEAFRLLNDELHNIQIITFDILLERAKNVLKIMGTEEQALNP